MLKQGVGWQDCLLRYEKLEHCELSRKGQQRSKVNGTGEGVCG